MDLIEFLRARLDEDEQTAREALKRTTTTRRWIQGEWVEDTVQPPEWRRSAWPPARVLREVEAKRRIVDKYAYWAALEESGGLSNHMRGERIAWLYACLNLAPIYADHPDYREDWRP